MSSFIVKGRKFKYKHIWFENIPEKLRGGGYDFLVLHGVDTVNLNNRFIEISKQETLISRLVDEEIIWSEISKTVRNEIRRSEKENTDVVFYNSEEITTALLNDIAIVHSEMYEQKGIIGHSINLAELKTYASNNSLIVSQAFIDESKIYHVYIYDKNNARLLISCSLFRNEDKDTRNRIGRANKYLHWRDFLQLMTQGITVYDWGGIFSITDPNGIDMFKMSFGGKNKSYYNVTVPVSLMAKGFVSFAKKS